MKDFGRWFQEQALPTPKAQAKVTAAQLEALGFEVEDDDAGNVTAVKCRCCVCGNEIEISDYLTAEEILEDGDSSGEYCGGSPRCCP